MFNELYWAFVIINAGKLLGLVLALGIVCLVGSIILSIIPSDNVDDEKHFFCLTGSLKKYGLIGVVIGGLVVFCPSDKQLLMIYGYEAITKPQFLEVCDHLKNRIIEESR